MNKDQKAEQVKEIAAALSESTAVFAVDYRGISVPQAAELRTKLSDADASFKVVKNRLARRAIEETKVDSLTELLDGPTALTLIKGDPVIAAKAISNFAREHDVLVFKGGIMDGKPLAPDEFVAIARLPAAEVLHGQLVGLVASPLTGLAAGLNNLISGLGRQLAQIAEQGLVTGEAPDAGSDPSPAEDAEPADDAGSDPTVDAEVDKPEARTEEEPAEDAPVEGAGEDVEEPPADDQDAGSDTQADDPAEPAADEGSDPPAETSDEKETEEEN
jgi:large subunit ribosomal protein L10